MKQWVKARAKAGTGKKPPVDGIVRDRRWFAGLPVIVWLAVAFFVVSFGVGLVEGLLEAAGLHLSADENVFNAASYAGIFGLLLVVVLGVPRLVKTWSGRISYRRLLGLTRLLWWRDILFGLLGYAAYFALLIAVMSAVVALIPGFNADQVQETGFTKTLEPGSAVIVFLSLVVIPPLVEETLFRGYLFGTLRRAMPVWVAAVITSLMFALAHLQLNVGVDVFLLSLVSCYLRFKTGSLWASIVIHALKNGVAFYFLYIATGSIV